MRTPISALTAAVALAAPVLLADGGPAVAAPPTRAAPAAATASTSSSTSSITSSASSFSFAAATSSTTGTTAVGGTSGAAGAAEAPRDVALIGGGSVLSVVDMTRDQRAITIQGFQEIRGVAMLPERRLAYVADRVSSHTDTSSHHRA